MTATRTFVLRLKSSDDGGVRGEVEDVAAGERTVVRSLEELGAVLVQQKGQQDWRRDEQAGRG